MAEQRVGGFAAEDLIYDWNLRSPLTSSERPALSFCDETLRDGLQNPSVIDPKLADKILLLHSMDGIGIQVADVGLPAASARSFEHALALCREIERSRMKIRPVVAGRTLAADVKPILDISQKAGLPVEVYVFIGSSPIRQLTEAWDLDRMTRLSAEAIDLAVREGLAVGFVIEDATRSRPEVLSTLIKVAVGHGASRICLADTVGHATLDGVEALISFVRSVLAEVATTEIGIDWHGHNDRGFALVNTLHALRCGADRLHGTALGIGERAGNAPMELVLVNLKLLGLLQEQDLGGVIDYCRMAASMLGWTVPVNYPVVGRDAFRTATGVHASAILKAEAMGQQALADRVYSAIPAAMFGRHQEIEIGYMSGASNVVHWLQREQITVTIELVAAVLRAAKLVDHILVREEVMEVIRSVQGSTGQRNCSAPR
jgi:2-isopropylmalate synthase